MVKCLKLLAILLTLPLCLAALPPRVRVTVDANGVASDQSFAARLEITIDQEQDAVIDGFEMDGNTLDVQFLGQQIGFASTMINGKLTQEHKTTYRYQFELPPQEVGVHVIPPISVKIDGTRYSSDATTYSVFEPQTIDEFVLEAAVEGRVPVFPGQELEFVYSLHAPGNMQLEGEYLPLLQAEGFRLLGNRERQSAREGRGHHWLIRQKVLALQPGTYYFGPSYFEGYLVKRSFFGGTQAISKRLRATAPIVTVVVNPFPVIGQPSWFDGALGSFTISSQLLSPQTVGVGDRILVSVTVEGDGELSTVKLPKLAAQPGFENFRIGDLQGSGKNVGNSKQFTVELRPLDDSVTAIPPIHFAYYEPKGGRYETVSTEPLSLTVESLGDLPPGLEFQEQIKQSEEAPRRPDSSATVFNKIPIAGNMILSMDDLKAHARSETTPFLLILLAAAFIGAQLLLQRTLRKRAEQGQRKRSKDWLLEARQQDDDEPFAPFVEKALLLRLVEQQHCAQVAKSARELSDQGPQGQVRSYLLHLEAQQYAGKHGASKETLLQEAQELFDHL